MAAAAGLQETIRSSRSTTMSAGPATSEPGARPARSGRSALSRTKLSATQAMSPLPSATGTARTRQASGRSPGRPRSRKPSWASPVRNTRSGRQSAQRWARCHMEAKQWSVPQESSEVTSRTNEFANWIFISRSTRVMPMPSVASMSPNGVSSSGRLRRRGAAGTARL